MINTVKLNNIKCFSEQEFTLTNLNILAGVNGVGKSTVIQTLLLVFQTDTAEAIEFNGALVELGNYSDVQHENANDDSARITIKTSTSSYEWGYSDGFKKEENEIIVDLPLLTEKGEDLDGIRRNFVYLGAERWGPRDNVPLNAHNPNPYWLGKHGEFTIQFLHSLNSSVLRDEAGVSIGTTTKEDPRLHPSEESNVIFQNIIAWMGEISPNVSINAAVIEEAAIGYSSFSFNDSKKYKAINVGFGLSYALSIVTALMAAREGSIVILENPEAHLHPSGQSKLGQLMALAAKAGVQVIVETHSEHIINGARIMVRKDIVPADLIKIMYISRDENRHGSTVEVLELNEMGQVSNWPEGFFDQQAIDMKTLITGN